MTESQRKIYEEKPIDGGNQNTEAERENLKISTRKKESIFLIQRDAHKSMVGTIILINYDNESSTIISFNYLLPKRH